MITSKLLVQPLQNAGRVCRGGGEGGGEGNL